ncbi:hypothetical protein [Kitasatospora sp. NPDC057223]|uniref:hypothetical protein n=1 Tax=Kitasatospora sp. NPDC057223 TaxID=3346055 RepID=UPI0036338883
MNAEENRLSSTGPTTDRSGGPAGCPESHLAVGTPVPDDPELLFGDAKAARAALDASVPDAGGPAARAGQAVGRAGAAAVSKLGHTAGRTARRLRAARADRAVSGAQGRWQYDEITSGVRVPHLLAAGLAAGGVVVVVVRRRRRG